MRKEELENSEANNEGLTDEEDDSNPDEGENEPSDDREKVVNKTHDSDEINRLTMEKESLMSPDQMIRADQTKDSDQIATRRVRTR